jgi:hypothetical protein
MGLKGLVSNNLNPLVCNVWSNNPADCCHIFIFLLNDISFHKVGELFYDLGNEASDRVFMKANNVYFDGSKIYKQPTNAR